MKQAEIARLFIKAFSSYLNHLEKEISDYAYNFNEVKIILDILDKESTTAKDLEENLGLDKGYASRLIKNLVEEDILVREQVDEDKRSYLLSLSNNGQEVAQVLMQEYTSLIAQQLATMDEKPRQEMVEHMSAILKILEKTRPSDYPSM